MVTIRRCRTEDVADLLAFLDTHWKRGHVFTADRGLFDWQHGIRESPGEYSVAIARRGAEIVGVLGYICTRQLDPALAADNTLWLALWKVREDAGSAGLGLQLIRFVLDADPHVAAGVIGFNPAVTPLYRALGFSIGELRHHVMRNPDVARCELASFTGPARAVVPAASLDPASLDAENFEADTASLDLGERDRQAPRKTAAYFFARYLAHPVYRYRCVVCRDGRRPVALLAARIAEHAGRRALRIVDYLGAAEAIAGIGGVVLEELRRTGAEYADVYNAGVPPELWERAGFSPIDPEGPDVVPDHFEPFEARNVRLLYAVKADRPIVLFKGDADQDRPGVARP